ncbi:anti-ECFsigma factor, ChrR [Psychromonas ingrahamii 37]|uniref:Anti-ECFsigma factor, ChrR n=1 Tax=Psychromonas ingrahamii (strain DSM 17664 / CCUG 51855 / 37) TaxID=357804 RepID=A1STM0_PSYIN|nr:ChrR family anti-sigma-E factor [Psychromonas ingrahamii]ABM02835.1 anti-ECFsigma factor, ChrR [Psychromonas ingrahamii 37]
MIKHHPTSALLASHSAAQLPLSLSIAVSAHLEMCPKCVTVTRQITEQQSDLFEAQDVTKNINFSNILDKIFEHQPERQVEPKKVVMNSISVAGTEYQLPRAFTHFTDLKWSSFGAISRARVVKDTDNIRASLLHIDKNSIIPSHTHKGYELTLLLEGAFSDESGVYNKGDFIWLNNDLEHTPFTKEGCLCYAVQDAPLRFVSGISQALNPLGQLIY